MAFDFLIRGINKTVGDGTKTEDESMAVSNRKGAIVSCLPAGAESPSRHLQGKQIPPRWIVVRADIPESEAQRYCEAWMPNIAVEWESLNVNADRWRVVVRSRLMRKSDNHGKMDEGKTKGFMEAWDFTNITYLNNRTRGRNTIFDMAKSRSLWKAMADSTFNELSYDQATGIHTIRMDYTAVRPNKDVEVLALVEGMEETTFIAQDAAANTIDFSVERDVIKASFEADVERRLEKRIATRRYVFDEAEVDRIISGSGFEEMTEAQFNAAMTDITGNDGAMPASASSSMARLR